MHTLAVSTKSPGPLWDLYIYNTHTYLPLYVKSFTLRLMFHGSGWHPLFVEERRHPGAVPATPSTSVSDVFVVRNE